MSINQATDLLLRSEAMVQGGEVFVAKMKSVKIIDLANTIIEELCTNTKPTKLNIIGRGPGEKLFEELMTESESEQALETEDTFIILPEITEFLQTENFRYPNAVPAKTKGYRSDNAEILTKSEIKALFNQENLL